MGNLTTTALLIQRGRIEACFTVRNPDKLAHVERLVGMTASRYAH